MSENINYGPSHIADRVRRKLPPSYFQRLVRSCVTVAELKEFIADWPEIDAMGEPTEVWLETGKNLTSPCNEVCSLNLRIREDGTPTSDLCFSPSPTVWDSSANA